MSDMQPHDEALVNMHKTFLEALRHREQEILRFVALLGTALGGFVWILGAEAFREPARFTAGTYGVLLGLGVGACYGLALGYNYRYLTLQLAKLESRANLGLKRSILRHWPREPEQFERKSRWGVIPWCTPPGIIKVFWIGFLVSILGVTVAASVAKEEIVWTRPDETAATQPASDAGSAPTKAARQASSPRAKEDAGKRRERWMPLLRPIPHLGIACFLFAVLGPIHVGRKMLKACTEEDPREWLDSGTGQEGDENAGQTEQQPDAEPPQDNG